VVAVLVNVVDGTGAGSREAFEVVLVLEDVDVAVDADFSGTDCEEGAGSFGVG